MAGWVLGLSILLQLAAAIWALRLIRVTGRRLAWTLIATAIALMAIRRGITLYHLQFSESITPPDFSAELVALTISVLMLIGVVLIEPVFRSLQQSQRALSERERQYRSVFETTTDGLMIFEPEGKIVEANPAACRMYGYSRPDFLQLSPQEFITPDYHHFFEDFVSTVNEGRPFHCESEDVRKDGTVFPVEVRGVSFFFKGKPHLLGVIRDISERRQAEEQKEAIQQELLRQQEKMRENTELELAKVRDELIESTRLATIGRVTAQIAHDIRNPLASIRNAAYLLKRKLSKSDGQLAECAILIDEEIQVCDRIVDNLLEVTRAKELDCESINFVGLGTNAISRLQVPAGVSINISCDPDPFSIYVDAVQFRRVLDNLLNNACDAVGENGQIEIQARKTAETDMIQVKNTGLRIPDDKRDSVFAWFYTTKARGNGLGLAICRQIVAKHQGTIKLLSNHSEGTTFQIELPRPID